VVVEGYGSRATFPRQLGTCAKRQAVRVHLRGPLPLASGQHRPISAPSAATRKGSVQLPLPLLPVAVKCLSRRRKER
jgi:hypothetical protein